MQFFCVVFPSPSPLPRGEEALLYVQKCSPSPLKEKGLGDEVFTCYYTAMILFYCAGLVLCFYLLAKVCEDHFVPSLEIISQRLKLSQDVAGATLMAIGSSAPELFTALIALTKAGSESIGAGTIVGSAIFNVLVIVGASAVAARTVLNWKPVLRDILFYIISILLLLFTFKDGQIFIGEALMFLLGYMAYILLLSQWSKWFPDPVKNVQPQEEVLEEEDGFFAPLHKGVGSILDLIIPKTNGGCMGAFFMSILLIGAISWVLVELAVLLAHALHISEVVIALTVLAAGTSVPDLLSSIIVAKKGRGGMAVSNAVGSNTFDILIGLGFPWMLYILITGKEVGVSTENLLSSIFLLFFTVVALLTLLITQRFKIGWRSGYLLLGIYVLYVLYALYTAYYPNAFGLERVIESIL